MKKQFIFLLFMSLIVTSCDVYLSSSLDSTDQSSSVQILSSKDSDESSSHESSSSHEESSSSSNDSSSSSSVEESSSSSSSTSTNSSSLSSSSTGQVLNNYTCENTTPSDGNLLNSECLVPDGVEAKRSFAGKNYTYAWSDEFNDEQLNENYWTYEIGTGQNGWGNSELQYYVKENTQLLNGNLVITAKKEFKVSRNYTSSRLITQDKVFFKYGFIEAKIKLPSFKGIWPAFWMLGQSYNSIGWAKCGEIDIMEAINNEDRKTHSALHWYQSSSIAHAEHSGQHTLSSSRTQSHLYQMVWSSTKISCYVDNELGFSMDITGSAVSEFLANFFFIFNVAVGGNWPGFDIDSNGFPATMEVDYVRVYQ